MIQHPTPDQISPALVQQRRILAMMGVDMWVQRDAATQMMDEVQIQTLSSSVSSALVNEPSAVSADVANNHAPVGHSSNSPANPASNQLSSQPIPTTISSTKPTKPTQATPTQAATIQDAPKQSKPANLPSQQADELAGDNDTQEVALRTAASHSMSTSQVEPFTLVGLRYHSWVLIVDAAHLKEEQTAMLWQNISQALSVSVEQLQFPICEGIRDKESADASVAGFVFRLAKRADAKVAALTPLPDSIDYDNLIRVPYLQEMLQDSRQKKQLWQLIKS